MALRGWSWEAALGPAGQGDRPLLEALAAAIPNETVEATIEATGTRERRRRRLPRLLSVRIEQTARREDHETAESECEGDEGKERAKERDDAAERAGHGSPRDSRRERTSRATAFAAGDGSRARRNRIEGGASGARCPAEGVGINRMPSPACAGLGSVWGCP